MTNCHISWTETCQQHRFKISVSYFDLRNFALMFGVKVVCKADVILF
jgi:hypothetical protein